MGQLQCLVVIEEIAIACITPSSTAHFASYHLVLFSQLWRDTTGEGCGTDMENPNPLITQGMREQIAPILHACFLEFLMSNPREHICRLHSTVEHQESTSFHGDQRVALKDASVWVKTSRYSQALRFPQSHVDLAVDWLAGTDSYPVGDDTAPMRRTVADGVKVLRKHYRARVQNDLKKYML